jgi:hypothetical protein
MERERVAGPGVGGDLYVGGDFTLAGDKPSFHIARWHEAPGPPQDQEPGGGESASGDEGAGGDPDDADGTAPDQGTLSVPATAALRFANPGRLPLPIVVELPYTAAVELALFDVRGRRLGTVFSGVLDAGLERIEWNGELASGRAPAGVYFLRVDLGSTRTVRSLILQR